jgi:hypothetical protein
LACQSLPYPRLAQLSGFKVGLKYAELDYARLSGHGFHWLTPGKCSRV